MTMTLYIACAVVDGVRRESTPCGYREHAAAELFAQWPEAKTCCTSPNGAGIVFHDRQAVWPDEREERA